MRFVICLCTLGVCMGQPFVVSLKSLKDQPRHEAAKFIKKAMRSYEKGEPESCKKWLDAAIAVEPGSAKLLATAGALAVEQREFERAADLFTQATDADPTDPELLSYAAIAQGLVLDFEKAIRYSRESLRYDPTNARSNYILGISLATRNRNLPEAARSLERATDFHPESRLFLSWVYARLGQWQKAEGVCHQFLGKAEPLDTCLKAVTDPKR